MSDLAKFVAATIRDKVVQDLMDELEGYRKTMATLEAHNMELMKDQCLVTGANGMPIYYKTHKYRHQKNELDDDNRIMTEKRAWNIHTCPIKDLLNAQVYFKDRVLKLAGASQRIVGKGQGPYPRRVVYRFSWGIDSPSLDVAIAPPARVYELLNDINSPDPTLEMLNLTNEEVGDKVRFKWIRF